MRKSSSPPSEPAAEPTEISHDASNDSQAQTVLNDRMLLEAAIALAAFDPDEDEMVWRDRRLAALAKAAWEYPWLEDALKWLAQHWSSGALRNRPSERWFKPDRHTGLSRAWTFSDQWDRLIKGGWSDNTPDLTQLTQAAADMEKQASRRLPTLHFGTPTWAESCVTPSLLH